jgi:hypothetical protein
VAGRTASRKLFPAEWNAQKKTRTEGARVLKRDSGFRPELRIPLWHHIVQRLHTPVRGMTNRRSASDAAVFIHAALARSVLLPICSHRGAGLNRDKFEPLPMNDSEIGKSQCCGNRDTMWESRD